MTSLENQYFMPMHTDSWLLQAFTQDNNSILTTNTFYHHSDDPFSPLSDMVRPESASSSVSGSDLDTRHNPIQKRITAVCDKKIMKRKSRGGNKKNTTTFVNADASNFRQLVQQMTGVKLGVAQVLKPEPQRVCNQFQGSLPTLDTSAFFFDHHQEFAACTSTTAMGQQGYFPAQGSAGLNNECFPTLESWVGM